MHYNLIFWWRNILCMKFRVFSVYLSWLTKRYLLIRNESIAYCKQVSTTACLPPTYGKFPCICYPSDDCLLQASDMRILCFRLKTRSNITRIYFKLFWLFSNFPPFSIFYRVYFRLIYRLSIPIWNFPKLSFPPKSYTSTVLIDYIIYHGYEIHPYKYSS